MSASLENNNVTENSIEAYIRAHAILTITGRIRSITEANGGVLNPVYKIEAKEGNFFLKHFPGYYKGRPDRSRNSGYYFNETGAYKALKPVLGNRIPDLVYEDEVNRTFITRELADNSGNSLRDLFQLGFFPRNIASRVGNVLATLHFQAKPDETQRVQSGAGEYSRMIIESGLHTSGLLNDPGSEGIVNAYDEMLLPQNTTSIILGDLYPKNVLLTTKDDVGLIDLEFVDLGDPAFDLGFIFAHTHISAVINNRMHDGSDFIDNIDSAYQKRSSYFVDQKTTRGVISRAKVAAYVLNHSLLSQTREYEGLDESFHERVKMNAEILFCRSGEI